MWDLLFSEDMVHEFIMWTNRKLSHIREKFKNSNHSTLKVEAVEILDFLGLHVYREVFKWGRESIEGMFATDGPGRDVFKFTMPQRR